jgi:hypothetical protein
MTMAMSILTIIIILLMTTTTTTIHPFLSKKVVVVVVVVVIVLAVVGRNQWTVAGVVYATKMAQNSNVPGAKGNPAALQH